MPVFQDSESLPQSELVDEGEYILTVYEFSTELSSGRKTNGCEKFNVVYLIEGTKGKIWENLIDHESCLWKIDAFLKACGIRSLQKGQAFHFEKDKAEEKDIVWVNPMGLRCWAQVGHETYTSNRTGKPVTKNVVVSYITDRPALKPDPELRNKPTGSSDQQAKTDNPFGNTKTPF